MPASFVRRPGARVRLAIAVASAAIAGFVTFASSPAIAAEVVFGSELPRLDVIARTVGEPPPRIDAPTAADTLVTTHRPPGALLFVESTTWESAVVSPATAAQTRLTPAGVTLSSMFEAPGEFAVRVRRPRHEAFAIHDANGAHLRDVPIGADALAMLAVVGTRYGTVPPDDCEGEPCDTGDADAGDTGAGDVDDADVPDAGDVGLPDVDDADVDDTDVPDAGDVGLADVDDADVPDVEDVRFTDADRDAPSDTVEGDTRSRDPDLVDPGDDLRGEDPDLLPGPDSADGSGDGGGASEPEAPDGREGARSGGCAAAGGGHGATALPTAMLVLAIGFAARRKRRGTS